MGDLIDGPWKENEEQERQNKLMESFKGKDMTEAMEEKHGIPVYHCRSCDFKIMKTEKDPKSVISLPLLIASDNRPVTVPALVCPKCRSLQIEAEVHNEILKSINSNIIKPGKI